MTDNYILTEFYLSSRSGNNYHHIIVTDSDYDIFTNYEYNAQTEQYIGESVDVFINDIDAYLVHDTVRRKIDVYKSARFYEIEQELKQAIESIDIC